MDHAGCQRVSASVAFAAFIPLLLAGCSTSTTLLADPGRFSVYHCDAMPGKLAGIQERQRELSNLMARASDGAGGALIGTMSYRGVTKSRSKRKRFCDELRPRRTAIFHHRHLA
jgi:hypothetical protein